MAFEYLNIALLESDIIADDKKSNLDALCSSSMPYCDAVDIVVAPELFTTGFINDKDKAFAASERNTETTMNYLHSLSEQLNSALCGSFLAHTASKIYNRAFFIEPSGDEVFYDKRHLFSMGGESNIITAGTNFAPVVRFRGWNIKFMICYDLRFPVFCRNKRNEYDLMIVVANWPEARQKAWLRLLSARAIENCCYVCGVNRRGVDAQGNSYGAGSSVVIDYKGDIIAQTSETASICTASISKEKLDNFRLKFPVWNDADDFVIKYFMPL